ncbi:hypothetical protein P7C70_g792, partial [Phenoliferia sp. Uapishka_3]
MSPIPSLPVELIQQIVNHCCGPIYHPGRYEPPDESSFPTLLSLCLVCRLLRELAQPLLYRHVKIYQSADRGPNLAASDAFLRLGVEFLDLEETSDTDPETILELVMGAGRRLRRLELSYFDVDARIFEHAGIHLTHLEIIACRVTQQGTSTGWSLPFRLEHLGLLELEERDHRMSKSFLSALIAPPSLTSLDITFETMYEGRDKRGSTLDLLFSLPTFPAFAAQITSLTLLELPGGSIYQNGLALFTSLSHLTVHQNTRMDTLFALVDSLSFKPPTLKHLTVGFTNEEPNWHGFIHLKALAKLTLITWSELEKEDVSQELLDVLRAGREITMEWMASET